MTPDPIAPDACKRGVCDCEPWHRYGPEHGTDPIAPDALREAVAPTPEMMAAVREAASGVTPPPGWSMTEWVDRYGMWAGYAGVVAAALAKHRDAEVERRVQQVLPCDGGCNYGDGPMEDCSRHGRPVREVWQIVSDVAAERDTEHAIATGYMQERDDAQDRITRALAVHAPVEANGGKWCRRCTDTTTGHATFALWPCDTVRILTDPSTTDARPDGESK